MIICPRCSQDYVKSATLKVKKMQFLICPECEAVWPKQVQPSHPGWTTLADFLEQENLDWSWEHFTIDSD